ncbi:MAG: SgcQ protein [Candidatus Heimdallarchaeota archaeon]|nr:SgcQ protein [Candidatus Heimdallarchaeota archaeon]
MTCLDEIFNVKKPVIGMVHFPPLPYTPEFNEEEGMGKIFSSAKQDLLALQEGGIDGLLFCNEGDRPYATGVNQVVVASMAAVIGELKSEISIPYGIDIMWDPISALAVAKATGAKFVRGVFTGAFAGDMGFLNAPGAETLRYRKAIGANDIKIFGIVNAEFAHPLDQRSLALIAKGAVFVGIADALCVSGPMTGMEAKLDELKTVKANSLGAAVIVNTGARKDNIIKQLEVADGVIVGTSLKFNGDTWKNVDIKRVREFMEAVQQVR